MIESIEDAIINRIKNANLGVKKVEPLGADIKNIWTQTTLWPAIVVGYDGGEDKPQTSTTFSFEKHWNLFVLTKNLRSTSKARDDAYNLIDSLRILFSGVRGEEIGLNNVEIIYPTTDEPVVLERGRIVWLLRLKVIGWR